MRAPRALIAEDEALLAASLQADLAALWPELQIVASVGDGLRAAEQTLALRPDVCFFDIRMPGASGLQAAQALAEDWPDADAGAAAPFPLLVFVTAYDDHAVQAFEAQAVDYLLKPVDRSRLAACVARLQRRLLDRVPAGLPAGLPAGVRAGAQHQPAPSRPDLALQAAVEQLRALLPAALAPAATDAAGRSASAPLTVVQAQVGNLVHLVPVENVLYFEAADKYVRVVTAEREHLLRASLRELLPQLDPAQFWQVHRGTVVQARAVAMARREESGKVTLTLRGCADQLTVSRLYAHLFKGM